MYIPKGSTDRPNHIGTTSFNEILKKRQVLCFKDSEIHMDKTYRQVL